MSGSRVVALGHYQPARVLTNDELATMVDTTDEWITSRVGIKTRHIVAADEQVDEMAALAGEKALANAGLTAAEVDMVVVATCTALDRSPNMAAQVARRLGVPSPAALDIGVACSGFSHALATADHAIRAGAATNALVIGAGEADRLRRLDRPVDLRTDRRRRRWGRADSLGRARRRAGSVGFGARDERGG